MKSAGQRMEEESTGGEAEGTRGTAPAGGGAATGADRGNTMPEPRSKM